MKETSNTEIIQKYYDERICSKKERIQLQIRGICFWIVGYLTAMKKHMNFQEEGKYIEFGAGKGDKLNILLSKIRERIDVQGLEISQEMIREAERKYPKLRGKITQGDMTNLENIEDDSLDGGFCFQSLHHLSLTQLETFFSELKRILKNEATVGIIDTFNPEKNILQKLIFRFIEINYAIISQSKNKNKFSNNELYKNQNRDVFILLMKQEGFHLIYDSRKNPFNRVRYFISEPLVFQCRKD